MKHYFAKHYFAATAAIFGIAVAALELAGLARAAALGGPNATDAVNQLRGQGYTVQVEVDDGLRLVPLSACTVREVNALSGSDAAGKPLTAAQTGTVYVDVSCPDDDS
jgi:hypothetical protein